MTITFDDKHPQYREYVRLTTELAKHRKRMLDLYKRRDVLLGRRENPEAPLLKPSQRPVVIVPTPTQMSAPAPATNGAAKRKGRPAAAPAKTARRPPLGVQVLELLTEYARRIFTVGEITAALGLPAKLAGTVAAEADKLVKAGKVVKAGKGRATTYVAL